MATTIYVRGEGGGIFAMDLPLPESIQERFDKGLIQRVHSDGSPYVPRTTAPAAAAAPAPAPSGADSSLTTGAVPRPGARASKTDWVLWAMAVHAIPEDTAEGMTVAQLKELPEEPKEPSETEDRDQAPRVPAEGRPADNASKSEWIAYVVKSGRMSAEDAANLTRDDLIDLMS